MSSPILDSGGGSPFTTTVGSSLRLLAFLGPRVTAEPLNSGLRRSPAIWEVMNAAGQLTGVVNWWGTWPAQSEGVRLDPDVVLLGPYSIAGIPGGTKTQQRIGLEEGITFAHAIVPGLGGGKQADGHLRHGHGDGERGNQEDEAPGSHPAARKGRHSGKPACRQFEPQARRLGR